MQRYVNNCKINDMGPCRVKVKKYFENSRELKN